MTSGIDGPPLPDEVLVVVVLEERLDGQLHPGADVEVLDRRALVVWPRITRPPSSSSTARAKARRGRWW
jgi:hypothetical protein